MSKILSLATAASLASTQIQAQEQGQLALPEHIAGAISCIIEKGVSYGPRNYLFDTGRVVGSIDFGENGDQVLGIIAQNRVFEDEQDAKNGIIFDGEGKEVIMGEEVFEHSVESYDLNPFIREIDAACDQGDNSAMS